MTKLFYIILTVFVFWCSPSAICSESIDSLLTSLNHPTNHSFLGSAIASIYAPKMWFHREEADMPMDPLAYIRNSSLWFRNIWASDFLIVKKGAVNPISLSTSAMMPYRATPKIFWWKHSYTVSPSGPLALASPQQPGIFWNGMGFYLKNDDTQRKPAAEETKSVDAPMFWKLSDGLYADRIRDLAPGARLVLIEYWYYLPFSRATRLGLGNHEGDWEGLSVLVELKETDAGVTHKPIALFYAAHGKGTWHCEQDVDWNETSPYPKAHPQAFSALGTHATYSKKGKFSAFLIEDETEDGTAWDTWTHLRPIVLEPYYGFQGAWGSVGSLSFMSGPKAPGPHTKGIPEEQTEKKFQELKKFLKEKCSLTYF